MGKNLSIQIFNCFLLFFSGNIFCQTLPYNILFDDTKVNSINILIDEDSLTQLYDDVYSNHEYNVTFIYDDGITTNTIENVGFRLRGNTSRSAAKKSFKVSFNTFNSGSTYHGIEKLDLNGSHNDPSMIREKLYFDVYNAWGLPQRRSSFVKMYINGFYYGVYLNVEEMDELFLRERFGESTGNLYKCTYPADLQYLGSNQSSYKYIGGTGCRAYELQTNEQYDDYLT